jgi:carbon monoxide dehydrogenase subunit G
MTRFSAQIAIAADSQRVWQVLADFERWSEWTPTIHRLERASPGPICVGSSVHIEQPKLKPAVWTITVWNPTHDFTWVSRTPGVRAAAEHIIETIAEGSKVTLTIAFGGLLGGLIGLLSRSLINRYLVLEAAGLKQRCESAAQR